MKLFSLRTERLGVYNVVAETPNDAMKLLADALSDADYGFYGDREVRNIEIITSEVIIGFNDKPNFGDEHRLLITKSLKTEK